MKRNTVTAIVSAVVFATLVVDLSDNVNELLGRKQFLKVARHERDVIEQVGAADAMKLGVQLFQLTESRGQVRHHVDHIAR